MSACSCNVFYSHSKLRIIFGFNILWKRGFPRGVRYYAVLIPFSRANQGYISNQVRFSSHQWCIFLATSLVWTSTKRFLQQWTPSGLEVSPGSAAQAELSINRQVSWELWHIHMKVSFAQRSGGEGCCGKENFPGSQDQAPRNTNILLSCSKFLQKKNSTKQIRRCEHLFTLNEC